MRTLSNNRNNAIGPWYVYSNNGPSNANGNNWGGRTPPQGGTSDFFLCPKVLRMLLNKSTLGPKLIKSDSVPAAVRPSARHSARVASQYPLEKHGLVGHLRPLEETCAERDALRHHFITRRAA